MALLLHAFAVEVYLHLTQAKADRLKRVSHVRQLQRGWNVPLDAGWLEKETLSDCDEFEYREISNQNETEEVEEGISTTTPEEETVTNLILCYEARPKMKALDDQWSINHSFEDSKGPFSEGRTSYV
jgi:hypothetical protein